MECPSCGSKCSDNSRYCSHCGAVLSKVCLECGQELGTHDNFCPNCGIRISLNNDQEDSQINDLKESETGMADEGITSLDSDPVENTIEQNDTVIQKQEVSIPFEGATTTHVVDESIDSSKSEPENDDGKVHWSTVIDGHPFKFATFYSYVGVWIAVISTFISLIFLSEIPSLFILFLCYLLIQIACGIGLYRFKRYAYLILIVIAWLAIGVSGFACMISLATEDPTTIFRKFLSCIAQIPFIVYFMKRSSAYTK